MGKGRARFFSHRKKKGVSVDSSVPPPVRHEDKNLNEQQQQENVYTSHIKASLLDSDSFPQLKVRLEALPRQSQNSEEEGDEYLSCSGEVDEFMSARGDALSQLSFSSYRGSPINGDFFSFTERGGSPTWAGQEEQLEGQEENEVTTSMEGGGIHGGVHGGDKEVKEGSTKTRSSRRIFHGRRLFHRKKGDKGEGADEKKIHLMEWTPEQVKSVKTVKQSKKKTAGTEPAVTVDAPEEYTSEQRRKHSPWRPWNRVQLQRALSFDGKDLHENIKSNEAGTAKVLEGVGRGEGQDGVAENLSTSTTGNSFKKPQLRIDVDAHVDSVQLLSVEEALTNNETSQGAVSKEMDEGKEINSNGEVGSGKSANPCFPGKRLPRQSSDVSNSSQSKEKVIETEGDGSPWSKLLSSRHKLSISWKRQGSSPSSKGGHGADVTSGQHRHVLEKPPAGKQVTQCSFDQPVPNSWAPVDPSTFLVRGANFFKDKVKLHPVNYSVYEPIGVDVFSQPEKLLHAAKYVSMPSHEPSQVDGIPGMLVVNVQVPLYSPSFLTTVHTDGEGFSLVMYLKIGERFQKEAPQYVKDHVRKFMVDEKEKVKTLWGGTSIASFRDRLKLIVKLVSWKDGSFGISERHLIDNWNEKPVVTKPQDYYFEGKDSLEVDLDVHRYSFVCRSALYALQERLKDCVYDLVLVIQGNGPKELPEFVLACVRIHQLDFVNRNTLYSKEPLLSPS